MALRSDSLDTMVAGILAQEIARGVSPPDILRYAAEVTRAAPAFRGCAVQLRRVECYFATVVRRRLLRCGGTKAAARLVADSVVDDLLAAGRDGADIVSELERGWGDRLPLDVIDAWRIRLCA